GVRPLSDGEFKTHIDPAPGGTPRQIRRDFALASYPVWAPDSQSLLFLGRHDSSNTVTSAVDWWITGIGEDESNQRSLIKTGACANLFLSGAILDNQCAAPGDWDRNHVYFSSPSAEGSNLWRVDLSPGRREITGKPLRVTSGKSFEIQPYVAP